MAQIPYASVVGSLMYAMVCTRPDISQAVSIVGRYMHNPGKGHWQAVKWILRYIPGFVFSIAGGPVSWRSILQSTVARRLRRLNTWR
ncbi:unnamed protein product [Prunus brigantina]